MFLILLFAHLSTMTSSVPNICNISVNEYAALNQLFVDTSGDYWTWNTLLPNITHWNFPSALHTPCRDNWQGIGCYFNSSISMCTITSLELPNYNLNGFLSNSIGDLSNLATLLMNNNDLTGSVPSSLQNLDYLENFDFSTNSLSGSIPFFHNANYLQQYNVRGNLFDGTISSEFQQFKNITFIGLSGNYLTSTLPSELCTLEWLQLLYVDTNPLIGTIPTEIGELSSLTALQIFSTSIHGTIPTSIGNLQYLESLVLFSNELTGELPSELGKLSKLQYFWMYSNSLTGSLPSEIGQMSSLLRFVGAYNQFTSTLPTTVGTMSSLQDMDVNGNSLTGTIPSQIGFASNLQYLYLQVNGFTGTFPEQISWLSSSLIQIEIYDNYLSGTLPSSLGNMTVLQNLIVSYNHFTNTIPSSLNQLTALQILNVSSNYLVGDLNPLFDDNQLVGLVIVDLSYNAFQGTLPSSLFQLKAMTALSVFSNCFKGTLPQDICNATLLNVLVMDGLSCGFACSVTLSNRKKKLVKGLFPDHLIRSTIPACVWSMPNLNTLHLSGNGLIGSIGAISSSSLLTDLNLANNEITGAIPVSLQTRGFQQLDLSGNKISGTLIKNFIVSNESSVLQLSINRLSGNLPPSFYAADSVNVLAGNLFQCNAKTKPIYDPYRDKNVCGSDDLNNAFIIWLVFSSIALITAWLFIYFEQRRELREDPENGFRSTFQESDQRKTEQVDSSPSFAGSISSKRSSLMITKQLVADARCNFRLWWYASSFRTSPTNCNKLISLLGQAARRVTILALFYVVVCMIAYVLMKNTSSEYSTHTIQYGWVVTSAYLHGLLPVILVLLFLLISEYVATRYSSNHLQIELAKRWFSEKKNIARWFELKEMWRACGQIRYLNWDNFVLPLLLQLVNAAMALVVNGAYVVALLNGIKENELFMLQVLLSWYKLLWSSVYIPWSISRLRFRSQSNLTGHQVLMNLVNFIAAPVIANAASDSNCLYYAFQGQAPISYSFDETQEFPYCFKNSTNQQVCTTQSSVVDLTTSLIPPWLYSYQCSSSLLSNYVPVLLFSYTMSGIVIPFLKFLAISLPASYFTVWGVSLDLFGRQANNSIMGNEIVVSVDMKANEEANKTQMNSTSSGHSGLSILSDQLIINWNKKRRLFRGPDILCKVLLNFSVMLTFGLASPMLGLAVAMDMLALFSLWRILIGRHMSLAKSSDLRVAWHEQLEEAVGEVIAGFLGGVLLVLAIANLFWCFMVFDMAADVYSNFAGGMTVLVAGVALPLILWMVHHLESMSANCDCFSPRDGDGGGGGGRKGDDGRAPTNSDDRKEDPTGRRSTTMELTNTVTPL